jgi:hypothetical protein
MSEAEKSVSWVVYLMTVRQPAEKRKAAVCELSEWDEMERARPGYHTLVRSGITNEAEAELLARGTSGDPKVRPRHDRKRRAHPIPISAPHSFTT